MSTGFKETNIEHQLDRVIHELRLQKFAIDEHAIVAITDPSGVITYVNDKFCSISKYSRDELIGKTHRVINSGYHPKSFFVDMWRTISSGETWHGEVCNQAKDGTLYWVDTTIVPFTDQTGKIDSYTAIRADITDRKEAEIQLAASNKELQKTNEELEQFVYTASHDLKSPIVTIQGFLSLLRKDLIDDRADRVMGFLDRVESAAVKLQESVNDLLELSRAGYINDEPVRVDMNALVAKVLGYHELDIKNLGVQISVDESLPEIHFDPQHMEDVIDNLISNALKYGMDAKTPELRISGERTGDEIRIRVADNGAGIDPKYHDRVFRIFERVNTTQGGTGIGLAIVKKVMTKFGGRVWVDSAPGQGCVFNLVFLADVSGLIQTEVSQEYGAV
jgi:PAS domain S-box-containing protein